MSSEGVRLAIFATTYALVSLGKLPLVKLDRPASALVGAAAMVTLGGFPLAGAYAAIDADVLVFLVGVMLLTAHLELGGFFDAAAEWLGHNFGTGHTLLAAVVTASGILSAFFMNDTMCLVLTPVVLATVRRMGMRPLPFLLAVALASNVGSSMAITGNPQNMLVGIASGIGYGHFMLALALPAMGGLVIIFIMVSLIFRRDLTPAPLSTSAAPTLGTAAGATRHDSRGSVPVVTSGDLRSAASAAERGKVHGDPAHSFDRVLVLKSLAVFAGALAGWTAGLPLALVAISAGALLLVVANRDPTEALDRVQWSLVVFFASLFVVTAAIRNTAPVNALSTLVLRHSGGGEWGEALVVSGAMIGLSNLVSNVPAVLLWLPVVPHLPDPHFVWLTIAMSSTFAGNLTLLGSVANIIVAQRAGAGGARLGFLDYLRVGVPVTLLTTAWGILALVLTR